jgi:hypothetical protein
LRNHTFSDRADLLTLNHLLERFVKIAFCTVFIGLVSALVIHSVTELELKLLLWFLFFHFNDGFNPDRISWFSRGELLITQKLIQTADTLIFLQWNLFGLLSNFTMVVINCLYGI